MLQGSNHCRKHDDGASRPVTLLDVSHQEHEQFLDLGVSRLRLILDGGLDGTDALDVLPVVDVCDTVQTGLSQIVLFLLPLLFFLFLKGLLRFCNHPSDSTNRLGQDIRRKNLALAEAHVGHKADDDFLARKTVFV